MEKNQFQVTWFLNQLKEREKSIPTTEIVARLLETGGSVITKFTTDQLTAAVDCWKAGGDKISIGRVLCPPSLWINIIAQNQGTFVLLNHWKGTTDESKRLEVPATAAGLTEKVCCFTSNDVRNALVKYIKFRKDGVSSRNLAPILNVDGTIVVGKFQFNDFFSEQTTSSDSIYPFGQFISISLVCKAVDISQLNLQDISDAPVFLEMAKASGLENANDQSYEDTEILREARKFWFFLEYFNSKNGKTRIIRPVLDKEVLKRELAKQNEEWTGDAIFASLGRFLQSFTARRDPNIREKRGMILYGPPGTGKTTIAIGLGGLGFTLVNKPLAAAEISGGLVGDSEKMLSALFERATEVPWLPCFLVLDEMDTIAPNRLTSSSQSSESSTKVLSTLLTVFGGARDVKNLFLVGGTNRLSSMDPAFLRRMHGKLFIGYWSPLERKKFLENSKTGSLNLSGVTKEQFDGLMDEIVAMSVNFSADNLSKLKSEIILAVDSGETPKTWSEHIRRLARDLCKSEEIYIGSDFMPEIMDKLPHISKESMHYILKQITYSEDCFPTGKMLLDRGRKTLEMQQACRGVVDIVTKAYEINRRDTSKTMEECEKLAAEELQMVAEMSADIKSGYQNVFYARLAKDLGVQFVSIISGATLARNRAAKDDEAVSYVIDLFDEVKSYDRTLIVVEMDSAVGVTPKTDNNLTSGKYNKATKINSVDAPVRPLLLNFLINAARSRPWVSQPDDSSKDCKGLWLLYVIYDEGISQTFRTTVEWPQSKRQAKIQAVEEKEHHCKECKVTYSFSRNRNDSCFRHKIKDHFWLLNANGSGGKMIENPHDLTFDEQRRVVWMCCNKYFLGSEKGCSEISSGHEHTDEEETIEEPEHSIKICATTFSDIPRPRSTQPGTQQPTPPMSTSHSTDTLSEESTPTRSTDRGAVPVQKTAIPMVLAMLDRLDRVKKYAQNPTRYFEIDNEGKASVNLGAKRLGNCRVCKTVLGESDWQICPSTEHGIHIRCVQNCCCKI